MIILPPKEGALWGESFYNMKPELVMDLLLVS